MNVVVFDFEVFAKDVLFGSILLEPGKEKKTFQTWDKEKIRDFYESHKNWIWVGHNNSHYDNYILQAIVKGQDPYKESNAIIRQNKKLKLEIQLWSYDLMYGHFASLKALEAFDGKNISESEVDFLMQRQLTDNEKRLTEEYNRDDLSQTYEDLIRLKSEFQLRLDIMKEFNMSPAVLGMTEAQIAAAVLGAKKIHGIENEIPKLPEYENLMVRNKEVMDFYRSKSWAWQNAMKPSMKAIFCGTNHTIAAGGIHAGEIRHEKEAYYLDVSGYYNLIMINYDLLPRTIPEEGRKLYEHMYHEQLRLKKKDPVKRKVYKTILLAVFGAMNNEHCDFYDPNFGDLVRLTGELFLVDLLEKLEGHVEVIQSNTDGIMIKPLENTSENDLKAIADEWQARTGFTLKFERIFDIVQRDVNNYMYRDEDGNIHTKGEAVKHYAGDESPFDTDAYNSKEPLIIHKCVVDYYMKGIRPETTIANNMDKIRLFQYILKTLSYDRLILDQGMRKTELQNVNRAFVGHDYGVVFKEKGGKRHRYPSMPDSVFVHNGSLNDSKEELKSKIKWSYYAERAYERIREFELPVRLV